MGSGREMGDERKNGWWEEEWEEGGMGAGGSMGGERKNGEKEWEEEEWEMEGEWEEGGSKAYSVYGPLPKLER